MNPNSRIALKQSVAILNAAVLLIVGPYGTRIAMAQNDAPPPLMPPDQLEQLVAPIALYPDPLLAQVLAASTYSTDVVDADRWVQQHRNLTGKQLSDAVVQANLPYDPSIISLLQFPTVLDKMSQDINWTASLGDAFLAQRGDVMDAVQRMRLKAQQIGNLKSSDQIRVVSSSNMIEIQPVQPAVIYVPTYNPQVVYVQGPSTGAVVAASLISFGLGVAVGAAVANNGCCWYGGSVAWRSHTVVVANTSYNRTWATRAVVPRPAPYYRAGGPYPVGRPPVGGTYKNVRVNNVNVNNVNVNNVNRNNVNVNNVNRNNVNRNNANVNNVNRNNANVNNANRNNANVNNANRTAPAYTANRTGANTASTANRSAGANTANRSAGSGAAANSGRGGRTNQPAAANRGAHQPSGANKSTTQRGPAAGRQEKR